MVQTSETDLAARSYYFRNSLIEEFRLSESDTCSAFEAPQHSSSVFEQPEALEDVLRHKPHSLIKFKIFKRAPEAADDSAPRLTRMATRKPGRLQRAPRSLPLHEWAKWLSTHKNFSTFVIGTILVNAIVLGIQTSMDEIEDWRMVQMLDVLDNCTMVIFVWEIVLKWVANFSKFWRDGWNVFDFLVTAGVLVPMLAQAAMGTEDQSNAQNFASVAKNLRIFRTFRTLKMIAKFRSLRIIVRTVMEALQSLGFVLILLCLLMYIFAVLAIGLFSDYSNSTEEGLEYQFVFSDMIAAVRTLFQLLTLDQWYNIAKEISDEGATNNIVTISFFVVWVALGAFIFRNIFIGVMVKNFQNISQELADLDQMSRKRARMRKYVEDFQHQMEVKKREIEQQMIHGRTGSDKHQGAKKSSADVAADLLGVHGQSAAASNEGSQNLGSRRVSNMTTLAGAARGPSMRDLMAQNPEDSAARRPRERKSFAIPKAWIENDDDDGPLAALQRAHAGASGGTPANGSAHGGRESGALGAPANGQGADGEGMQIRPSPGLVSPTEIRSPQTPHWAEARLSKFYNAAKAEDWKRFVQQSLTVFGEQDGGSTLWPRDTLLQYLQTMEKLQENLKEHHELQHLATEALYCIATDG